MIILVFSFTRNSQLSYSRLKFIAVTKCSRKRKGGVLTSCSIFLFILLPQGRFQIWRQKDRVHGRLWWKLWWFCKPVRRYFAYIIYYARTRKCTDFPHNKYQNISQMQTTFSFVFCRRWSSVCLRSGWNGRRNEQTGKIRSNNVDRVQRISSEEGQSQYRQIFAERSMSGKTNSTMPTTPCPYLYICLILK